MTAGQEATPPRTSLPASCALEIRIWCSGKGYTKATVHWSQGLNASRTAQRTLLKDAFHPRDIHTVKDALDLLDAIVAAFG